MNSPAGALIVILASLIFLLFTLLWARRPDRSERWLAVAAASLTSMLVIGITILAVNMGWWQGAFFDAILLPVQAAIFIPFSIAGYTLWLGWYRWLAGKTRWAGWIYAAVVLAFIPVVLVADGWQMQRGQFNMGGGYTVWWDALAGEIVMASPVLFYILLRRKAAQKA